MHPKLSISSLYTIKMHGECLQTTGRRRGSELPAASLLGLAAYAGTGGMEGYHQAGDYSGLLSVGALVF